MRKGTFGGAEMGARADSLPSPKNPPNTLKKTFPVQGPFLSFFFGKIIPLLKILFHI